MNTMNSALTCFKCHKPGHKAAAVACPSVRKLFCYDCGLKDVTRRNCWEGQEGGQHYCQRKGSAIKQPNPGSKKELGPSRYFSLGDWHQGLGVVKNFCSTGQVSFSQREVTVYDRPSCQTEPDLLPSKCVSPLFIRKERDERPYLDVYISTHSILALVDCGSEVTILGFNGMQILESLKVSLLTDESIQVSTADGKSQGVTGYVWLPMTLHDSTRLIKVLVVPSVKNGLLLGMDFLIEFGIKANFRNLSYHVEDKSVSVVNKLHSPNELTEVQTDKLNSIKILYKTIAPEGRLGLTNFMRHTINTGSEKPIKQRQYLLSYAMQRCLNEQIDVMLEIGIIQPSNSPWC